MPMPNAAAPNMAAETARAYIQNAWNMLAKLATLTLPENHPLIKERPVKKIAVILITSDRGLCGSYNSEILKKFLQFEKETCACNDETCKMYQGGCDVICIGKKRRRVYQSLQGRPADRRIQTALMTDFAGGGAGQGGIFQ